MYKASLLLENISLCSMARVLHSHSFNFFKSISSFSGAFENIWHIHFVNKLSTFLSFKCQLYKLDISHLKTTCRNSELS
jgi:hypothetical protein